MKTKLRKRASQLTSFYINKRRLTLYWCETATSISLLTRKSCPRYTSSTTEMKVCEKKHLYHTFLDNKTIGKWRRYLEVGRAAKKILPIAKATASADSWIDGERLIHRLARSRQRQTIDIEKFYGVNDERPIFAGPQEGDEAMEQQFENIWTEQLDHPPSPNSRPPTGPFCPLLLKRLRLH